MGNMLESDSSASSDIEVIEATGDNIRVRTAGDGMESDISSRNTSGLTPTKSSALLSTEGYYSTAEKNMPPAVSPDTSKGQSVIAVESEGPVTSAINQSLNLNRSSSNNSLTSKELAHHEMRGGLPVKSPGQLPSKELLIPIKPTVKYENSTSKENKTNLSSTSYDKFTAVGVGKQKNAKFVPYEPYSCATRPIVSGNNKQHARKPSDSSSVVSQSSTLSTSGQSSASVADANKSTTIATAKLEIPSPSANQSPKAEPVKRILNVRSDSVPGNTSNHHNSTALMKERLKMSEKELNELQTENSRLKRLLVDSMTGATPQPTSLMNQNIANGNAHKINESFDNLNDEIDVWRSKFLSSCVLVEQLTKDNQTLSGSVNSAAEILTDLKHSLPLTPRQYEVTNEWFRQAKPLIHPNSLSLHADENFNCENNDDM